MGRCLRTVLRPGLSTYQTFMFDSNYCHRCFTYHPAFVSCSIPMQTGKIQVPINIDRANGVLEVGDVRIELEDCWVPSVSIDGDKTVIKVKPA